MSVNNVWCVSKSWANKSDHREGRMLLTVPKLIIIMTLGNPANPCTCRDSCSRGRQLKLLLFLSSKQNKTTQQLLLGTLQTTLGCRKQPADSQIASYREKQCSHRTPGPPPASLLSIQSPSSPRRRSSEGGRRWGGTGGEAKKKNRRRLKRGRWSLCYKSPLP